MGVSNEEQPVQSLENMAPMLNTKCRCLFAFKNLKRKLVMPRVKSLPPINLNQYLEGRDHKYVSYEEEARM